MLQNALLCHWRFLKFEAAIFANHLAAILLESKFLLRFPNKLFAAKLQYPCLKNISLSSHYWC